MVTVLVARRRSKLNAKPPPSSTPKQALLLVVLVVLLIGGIWVLMGSCGQSSEEQLAEAHACLQDASCASNKASWLVDAEVRCAPHIEAFARYKHRWTDGFGESKFARVILQPSTGYTSLKYAGRKVEFQNGFGAWGNQGYTCHYDPLNKVVLDVEVY